MITKYYAIGGSFVLSIQIGAVQIIPGVFFRTFVFSAALRYNMGERRRERCEIHKAA